MAHDIDAASILRASGRRLTPQRLLIVSAIRDAPGHVTAADIVRRVQLDFPHVDVSTVYRTLSMLADQRLITQTDMGRGESVYEWAAAESHHHLICQRCGDTRQLDGRIFADLARSLREEYDFVPFLDHFAIFGLCSGCATPTPYAGSIRSRGRRGGR